MATLTLDIKDGQIEETDEYVRLTRYGFVNGINTSLPAHTLSAALFSTPGMPQIGNTHPGYATARLIQRRCYTDKDASGTQTRVDLIYQWDKLGQLQPGQHIMSFVLAERNYMQQEQAEFLWGNPQKAFRITYREPGGTTLPSKVVALPRMVGYRSIDAAITVYVKPTYDLRNAITMVNDRDWQGLPRGYWMVGPSSVQYSPLPVPTWTINAQFLSRVKRTWCEAAIWRDQMGNVPSDINLTALQSLVVQYGTMPNVYNMNGTLAADQYEIANFEDLFYVPANYTW